MNDSLSVAVYAALIAFTISVILCPVLIPLLIRLKFGQNVRSDGPKTHLKKAGTPSMGGIVIVLSIIAASVFFVNGNTESIVVILATLAFGLIGFTDDYIKIIMKRSLGLRAYQKLVLQFIVTTGLLLYLNFSGGLETDVYIPFANGYSLELGIFYIPLIYVFVIGGVNSVNITDGLDGLSSGVTVLVTLFFTFIAYAASSPLLPITGAVVGSLLGFLLFNSYPAKVIMGDTGSLALGGFVTVMAIMLKMPVFWALVGIIYVAEAASDIIQVSYFKYSKGKRIFKMAPLHHHFELSGFSETKVVALFYVITALMCMIGFLATKGIF